MLKRDDLPLSIKAAFCELLAFFFDNLDLPLETNYHQ
jgi:hypothetical protein